jgi:hypothetical protein
MLEFNNNARANLMLCLEEQFNLECIQMQTIIFWNNLLWLFQGIIFLLKWNPEVKATLKKQMSK